VNPRPTYAELLEAQLYDAPSHVTEQQRIARLEAELTELRRQLHDAAVAA
jgi:hypothetical protein